MAYPFMFNKSDKALDAYCVKCKEKQVMVNQVIKTSDSGRQMAVGNCPKCNTKMNRILGKATPNKPEVRGSITQATEGEHLRSRDAYGPILIGEIKGFCQNCRNLVEIETDRKIHPVPESDREYVEGSCPECKKFMVYLLPGDTPKIPEPTLPAMGGSPQTFYWSSTTTTTPAQHECDCCCECESGDEADDEADEPVRTHGSVFSKSVDDDELKARGYMTAEQFVKRLIPGLTEYLQQNWGKRDALLHPEDLFLNAQSYLEIGYHIVADFGVNNEA